jgi:hypothetical protein
MLTLPPSLTLRCTCGGDVFPVVRHVEGFVMVTCNKCKTEHKLVSEGGYLVELQPYVAGGLRLNAHTTTSAKVA